MFVDSNKGFHTLSASEAVQRGFSGFPATAEKYCHVFESALFEYGLIDLVEVVFPDITPNCFFCGYYDGKNFSPIYKILRENARKISVSDIRSGEVHFIVY